MKHARFLSSNEHNSLVIQPAASAEESSILFRQYCELDLLEVHFIRKCHQEDILVKHIDYETVIANFEGLTFFEIF